MKNRSSEKASSVEPFGPSEPINVEPSEATKPPATSLGPNCLLGICCPPAQQVVRLAEALELAVSEMAGGDELRRTGPVAAICQHQAEWLLSRFDVAPKGTTDLFRKVVEISKGP